MNRRRIYYYAVWAMTVALALPILGARLGVDYGSDSPPGISAGILTTALIIITIFTGWYRHGGHPGAYWARLLHAPFATLTLSMAFAHWHFRGREWIGLFAAALLLVVYFSGTYKKMRAVKPLHRLHKFGGYSLLLFGVIHGVRALFFAGS